MPDVDGAAISSICCAPAARSTPSIRMPTRSGRCASSRRGWPPRSLPENFRAEPIEQTSMPDRSASVVISSAVLHFARDDAQFDAMLASSWRVLAPGGMFFCRLASSIGLESRVVPLDAVGHRYRLPDGTTRYLVNESRLVDLTRHLGGQLLDPLKTTVVQDQRAMTTWVVRKSLGARCWVTTAPIPARGVASTQHPLRRGSGRALRIALRMMAMAPQVGHRCRLLAVLAAELAEPAAFGDTAFAGRVGALLVHGHEDLPDRRPAEGASAGRRRCRGALERLSIRLRSPASEDVAGGNGLVDIFVTRCGILRCATHFRDRAPAEPQSATV